MDHQCAPCGQQTLAWWPKLDCCVTDIIEVECEIWANSANLRNLLFHCRLSSHRIAVGDILKNSCDNNCITPGHHVGSHSNISDTRHNTVSDAFEKQMQSNNLSTVPLVLIRIEEKSTSFCNRRFVRFWSSNIDVAIVFVVVWNQCLREQLRATHSGESDRPLHIKNCNRRKWHAVHGDSDDNVLCGLFQDALLDDW